MENFSYSSYPDSGDSSPRSREIDCENQSWDEQPANNNTIGNVNYKVKFMCSYGGKIQPRSHDNQLAYVGGDTKILAVDRSIKFSAIMAKLQSLYGGDSKVCFKYQLPGEDLDALISVTNDEDLEHMMLEYDRLYRASAKPARLRLFLFSLNPPPTVASGFGGTEPKPERQWFVDALNSVQIQNLDGSSPPAAAVPPVNPDFLFGLDKVKLPDSVPPPVTNVVQEAGTKDVTAGSDCGSEDRHVIGDPVVSPSEIQRQIQELQRLQITEQRKIDESNARAYNTQDYYKMSDKTASSPAPGSVPLQMPIPTAYYQDRHLTTAYQVPTVAAAAAQGTDQPVYLIPASAAGVYQQPPTLRAVPGAAPQPYYGVQRVVQDVYREQPVYNAVPNTKVGAYPEGISMMQPKGGVPESGYLQVAYDGAGRQVYYQVMTPAVAGGGVAAVNQDGKVTVNAKAPPQTSSV
ncbi:Phox/Bem1p [Corchorus capsularis]|uniref:Phox/Bem1p n=1 Tax=Corchorus capsularis TaxID=210143 RepID=A0A1R3KYM8_COCAP|nr:Phox/Bem1p [Corchorus capsularis]